MTRGQKVAGGDRLASTLAPPASYRGRVSREGRRGTRRGAAGQGQPAGGAPTLFGTRQFVGKGSAAAPAAVRRALAPNSSASTQLKGSVVRTPRADGEGAVGCTRGRVRSPSQLHRPGLLAACPAGYPWPTGMSALPATPSRWPEMASSGPQLGWLGGWSPVGQAFPPAGAGGFPAPSSFDGQESPPNRQPGKAALRGSRPQCAVWEPLSLPMS